MVLLRVHKNPDKREQLNELVISSSRAEEPPVVWFKANPGAKPQIQVIPDSLENRQRVQFIVGRDFQNGSLSAKYATAFMMMEFKRKPGTLCTAWTSFGRHIGNQNQEITIANLVDLSEVQPIEDLPASVKDMDENEIRKYLIAIATTYRLLPIKNADYRKTIIEHAKKLTKGCGGVDIDFTLVHTHYASWPTHKQLSQILAAVDMFLNEFLYHDYSQVRIGTIVTRFKDCSVLSIKTAMDTLGFGPADLAEWIWIGTIADQFLKILRAGNEMDNSRSYAMYFMELGLSNKSPYSATSNPDLHLFVHTLGVCAGSTRSKNAILVGAPQTQSVVHNAVILHYVKGTFANFGETFTVGGTTEAPQYGIDDPQEPEDFPVDGSGPAWLGYLLSKHGRIPQKIQLHSAYSWNMDANCRPDNIGKMLYERSQALLARDL